MLPSLSSRGPPLLAEFLNRTRGSWPIQRWQSASFQAENSHVTPLRLCHQLSSKVAGGNFPQNLKSTGPRGKKDSPRRDGQDGGSARGAGTPVAEEGMRRGSSRRSFSFPPRGAKQPPSCRGKTLRGTEPGPPGLVFLGRGRGSFIAVGRTCDERLAPCFAVRSWIRGQGGRWRGFLGCVVKGPSRISTPWTPGR